VVLVHGHVDGHIFEGLDFGVGQHFAVDDVFNLLQLFVGDLCEVGEVKPQPSRIDGGAGLLDVRAEDGSERGVSR